MIHYPNIDPVAFSIGPIKILWYSLMYVFGLLAAFFIGKARLKNLSSKLTVDDLTNLIFYCAIGIVLGGRLGYVLFYNFSVYKNHPLSIFKLWEGGMSFHGGLIGVILAALFFSKKYKLNFVKLLDFIAPLAPIGLGLGRIGNFINGELWGRVSNVPWAMKFPRAGNIPRHPSQLYEAFFEGIVLFLILFIYSKKPRATGKVTAVGLISYGIIRFGLEFFRSPDHQLGFIAFNWMTMGQLLSIVMILIGLALMIFYPQKK